MKGYSFRSLTDLVLKIFKTKIIAGTGLSGGGSLEADRTLAVKYGTTAGTAAQGNDSRVVNAASNATVNAKEAALEAKKADKATTITAGTGLSGGGTLAANSSLSVKYGSATGTAAQGNDSRLSNSREWTAATISQAETEAGTATTRRAFTAQRVRQAIVAWFNIFQTTGTSTDFPMSQKATTDLLATKANTSTQVIAGTGLSGGGNLSANRTLTVKYGTAAGTAAQGNDSRLSNSREWIADTVSQDEAEAGAVTTRRAWTAQRVRQAIAGWWTGSADKAKLDGIAAGAQVNVATNLGSSGTGATRTITSSTGSNTSITYSAADVGAVPTVRTITAGTGLSGGGTLAANRTLSVEYGTAAGTAAQGNDRRIVNSVQTSGNQTIAGIKTFESFPVTPSTAPTQNYQAANKKYVDDTSALTLAAAFGGANQGLTANGYQKLPGGLIIQWGRVVDYYFQADVGITTIVFPVAFPSNVLNISLGQTTKNDNPDASWNVDNTNTPPTNTGFICRSGSTVSAGVVQGFYWFAVGN